MHHVAIGAVRERDGGDDGVGVARMVALDGEPGVAEVAITVVDDAQGLGLGTILFQRIMAAARERGVARIRCYVLGSNPAMQDLNKKLGATRSTVEQGVVAMEIDLPDVRPDATLDEAPKESGLYELLRLAARRVLSPPAR